MSETIPVNLAVEDRLSEAVLQRILAFSGKPFTIGQCYGSQGCDYLRTRIGGFNAAARTTPFIVLTDLDVCECAPVLIREWLPQQKHPNLMFRVAVREVESWLMADRHRFAKFICVAAHRIQAPADTIADPKRFLVNLARRSRKRAIREDIVPAQGSTSQVGKNYNGRLIEFVNRLWDVSAARQNSPSLDRAVAAVVNFTASWRGLS